MTTTTIPAREGKPCSFCDDTRLRPELPDGGGECWHCAPRYAQADLEAQIVEACTDLMDPDVKICECELDWNCPLHAGGYTALELINDARAEEERF